MDRSFDTPGFSLSNSFFFPNFCETPFSENVEDFASSNFPAHLLVSLSLTHSLAHSGPLSVRLHDWQLGIVIRLLIRVTWCAMHSPICSSPSGFCADQTNVTRWTRAERDGVVWLAQRHFLSGRYWITFPVRLIWILATHKPDLNSFWYRVVCTNELVPFELASTPNISTPRMSTLGISTPFELGHVRAILDRFAIRGQDAPL